MTLPVRCGPGRWAPVIRATALTCTLAAGPSAWASPVWLGSGIEAAQDPARAHSVASYQELDTRGPGIGLRLEFFPRRRCAPQARLRIAQPAGDMLRSIRVRIDQGRFWSYPLGQPTPARTMSFDWEMPAEMVRAIQTGHRLRLHLRYADAPPAVHRVPLGGAATAIRKALAACRNFGRMAPATPGPARTP